jgi:hypothetical protein
LMPNRVTAYNLQCTAVFFLKKKILIRNIIFQKKKRIFYV